MLFLNVTCYHCAVFSTNFNLHFVSVNLSFFVGTKILLVLNFHWMNVFFIGCGFPLADCVIQLMQLFSP